MRVIDDLEAKRTSKIDLGFPRERTVIAIERSSEAMRAVIWAVTSAGERPAFTTSLTNKFHELIPEQWMPDAHEEDNSLLDSARAVLDELHTLGDVENVGGGYWLPTPLRFVTSEAARWSLLVGGKPTFLLGPELRNCVSWSGPARLVQGATGKKFDGVPIQSVNTWAGIPDSELDQWTKETIQKLAFRPFDDSSESFEVYAPNISKRTDLQYKRWRAVSNKLPDGQYLAKQILGPIPHYAVVNFDSGEIKASAPVPSRIDVRRLRYGMDAVAGNPVRFKLIQEKSLYTLVVTSEVPTGECRLFQALGQLNVPTNSYYPRMWIFSKDVITEVIKAITKLGIRTFS